MAQKRMFSLHIVDSDAFLDMPVSSQLLYFHLCMRADDEGFVGNPKRIIRTIGANDDDYKVLITKRFVVTFESSVMVIKHWLIHNTIRMDRFNTTTYQDEKKLLSIKENKAYTLDKIDVATTRQPSGNQLETQVKLSKVKLSKVKLVKSSSNGEPLQEEDTFNSEIVNVIDSFSKVNPNNKRWYANTTQRASIERMLESHGLEMILKVIALLPKTNTMEYMPSITTPAQLEDKWASLSYALQKKKAEKITKNTIAEIS